MRSETGARSPAEAEMAEILPANHLQFPLLDSLRAFAAIAILVGHVAIFSGATDNAIYGNYLVHLDIGVPFFFLLSAFLLYRPFVAARASGRPRSSLGIYARRRFLRIAPAYWAVLTIAAIVPGMAGAFSGNWWAYYGLLQNYPIYTKAGACATDAVRCGIPVAWSLSVEVAFYAMLPLLVLAMDRIQRRRRPNWITKELIAVALIALVSIAIMARRPASDLGLWLFYSPLGRGWWFGLGLGLAAVSVWLESGGGRGLVERFPFKAWHAWAAALILYAFAGKIFEDSLLAFPLVGQGEFLAQFLVVGVIAALALLPAIFGQHAGGLPRRVLAHPSLAWLGLISYGIFLWQFPVLILLIDDVGILGLWPAMSFPILLIATFGCTVACAALSYYLLERPLLRRFR